jgi:ElaB/YqjD/DUF883 family membrane-anchored ribosome-binding protein
MKPMNTRKRAQNLKRIRSDLKTLVRDGENLLKDEGDNLSVKGAELRDQLAETLEAAQDCCADIEGKAWDQLEEVDNSVRKHPYQSIGIACGIGLLTGLIMGKGR